MLAGRLRPRLLALFAVLLAGCSREEPRWIALAGVPAAFSGTGAAPAALGPRALRRFESEGADWVEAAIECAEWHRMSRPGGWRAEPPLRALGRGLNTTARLTSGERSFTQVHAGENETLTGAPGSFALVGTWIVLQLEPGEEPPARAVLAERVPRRVSAGGRACVLGRRFSGDGFLVWPGERAELVLDLPPRSVLRLATTIEALQTDEAQRRVRFRVRLDGQMLLDHEQLEERDGSVARHELALPADGARGAHLVLEVDGDLGSTAFLEPVIAPSSPPRASRPDLVLFLADTFRADNLAACGGREGLTPELDALAARSLCFTQARSAGTYTAPAHASLFSGLYPQRASLDTFEKALPEGVVTIAEHLAAAGYRTGAVTGSVIVSRAFGLSQGFECFDEQRSDMATTQARVQSFLEGSDGRPTFLFVHTYRVHAPYASSAEGRARAEQVLGRRARGSFEDLTRGQGPVESKDAPSGAQARALAAELEVLYRAGVADMDGEFAAFCAASRVRELLEHATLLFASDHGEAFLEHDELFHAGRVFEEQLRIPLLLCGPGIAPGRRDEPVSLIDVAPTLADLAGVALLPEWQGRSLLRPGEPRPGLYAFECREDRPATVAVLSGPHKLVALLDQRTRTFLPPYAAFDLAADPHEEHDLKDARDPWLQTLALELERRRGELIEPWIAPAQAALDAEQRGDLDALGYGGR